MIAVMGASGHVGGRLAGQLLEWGEGVRVLGRSAERLQGLERMGAEVMVGDARDAGYLERAFEGATAAFTMLPYDVRSPDYRSEQAAIGRAVVSALAGARVPRAVFLSSVGADQAASTGLILSLHEHEQRLAGLDSTDSLVLRAGLFFESFESWLPGIRYGGAMVDSVDPRIELPMTATGDVASVAAYSIRSQDWTGMVVREVLGERDLTFAEAAEIIGKALGIPGTPYVRVPGEEMAGILVGTGCSEDFAGQYVAMTTGFNEGAIRATGRRQPVSFSPMRLEDFAESVLAPMWAAGR